MFFSSKLVFSTVIATLQIWYINKRYYGKDICPPFIWSTVIVWTQWFLGKYNIDAKNT